MHGRALLALILATLFAGCDADATPTEYERTADEPATAFDVSTAGSLTGVVTWEGPVPSLPAIHFNPATLDPTSKAALSKHAHPCLPRVDRMSRGVVGAVVQLRGVDAARGRRWNHGPACVEFADRELRIVQDGRAGSTGFVRVGDTVEVVRRGDEFCSLRARGAAYFALPLPDADQPSRRRLDRAGIVELTSGAGHWWQRAYLFVAEHPYCVSTDARGRFSLEGVPAGTYEVVCWLPSWEVLRHERNPESSFVARVELAPPREKTLTATIAAGQSGRIAFHWSAGDFEAAPLND